ncbi:MAG: glutathione peroxidase [Devosia sp. 67-54]|uniref:glutathione peroxidase n=1 Tax=unclassified Devosia TaxID=196773 RepID=UPI0009688600|nr:MULTISPECIES: glutathione peroxidase [unclassified Devosia]MBN9304337.1 glutathione peroxidase [Devosia sp.]OJX18143.1 MAG: glutathione peroxidase [Devosia sp. 67-54]
MTTLSDFTASRLGGAPEPLSAYAGKVALIVNVASQCGNTPQYEGLEALYRNYGPRGFVVLGFPCNQFGGQEAGSAEEIAAFCTLNYAVDFPMFAKLEVNGPAADPLYAWLKHETPGSADRDIEWNFAKFLVGRDGRPVRRFADKVQPADLAPDIETLL